MQIKSSLGAVEFEIEFSLKPDKLNAYAMLAAKNILAHSVGSKYRPDVYNEETAEKMEETIIEKFGDLFELKSFESRQWIAKDATSVSLKGMDADFIARIRAEVAAEKAKTKSTPTLPSAK
jgi:hypothetical protein